MKTGGMKALSLWQPWASLIADGRKKIETRHWPIAHRGYLAIHATQHVDKEACREFGYNPLIIPRGAVVCIVELEDCVRFPDPKAPPDAYGDFFEGRYGFLLRLVKKLEPPMPARGFQGVWEWSYGGTPE